MRDGIPEPGDLLGDKYLVEREIGRGGMGAVFAVSHVLTEKQLALKYLLPQHASDSDSVERFMREARAAGRVQHRHVIDVFDVSSAPGAAPFIVMPLLEGKPLSDLLWDDSLTLEHVLQVIVRAMEGIQAAHQVGIVHRDIKPCNIFVCRGLEGRLDDPRVLDFGISRVTDEASSRLTRSGAVVGTPYYMAIEQLTGARDVDLRADIYAMGVIVYEAIAGRPPHIAQNAAGLALELMHSRPTHLSVLRPELPVGLADAVMRSLARDRDDRYQSMAEFRAALQPFVAASARLRVPEPQAHRLRTPSGSFVQHVRGMTTAPSPPHGQLRAVEGRHASSSDATPRIVFSQRPRIVLWSALLVAAASAAFALMARAPATNEPAARTTAKAPAAEAPSAVGELRIPPPVAPQADLTAPPFQPEGGMAGHDAGSSARSSLRRAHDITTRGAALADERSDEASPEAGDGAVPEAPPGKRPLAPNELRPEQF